MRIVSAPTSYRRVPALDGLRAVLALWVMLAHAVLWSDIYQGAGSVPPVLDGIMARLAAFFQPLNETHPAVVCFIVLSGYCIHRSGLRAGDFRWRDYAVRRFFRIYPVYVAALLFGMAVFAFVAAGRPGLAIQAPGGLTAAAPAERLLGLSAIWPPFHATAALGNGPLLTVMVEAWLYAVYPLLLLVAVVRSERTMWLVILTVWLVGVVAATLWPSLQNWWHNGSLFGFLAYWWIGAKAVEPAFRARLRRALPVIAMAWVVLSVAVVEGFAAIFPVIEMRKALLALLCASFIGALDRDDLRLAAPIAAVGLAGYSLYAFHAPVLYASIAAGVPWWAAVACALLLGAAMFVLIERPGIRLGARLLARGARAAFSRRAAATVVVPSMAALESAPPLSPSAGPRSR